MKPTLPPWGLFLLTTLPAAGQGLSNQGALISIQPGVQVSVVGDISIGSSGTIDNAGTLTLTGNWTNNAGSGVLTPGTGTVQLTGTATQQLGGSSATTFHSLDVSGATGPVQLTADQAVGASGGVLALGATQLQLNSKVLTLNNGAATALTRTTGRLISETLPAAGYGRLLWVIGANTGTYSIPMGTATADLPITAVISTAGTGATGSLSVATYPTPANNTPLPTGITNLQGDANKALDRFWVVQPANYTTAPSATLTFSYQEAEWNTAPNSITEASLRLQRWNGTRFEAPQGSVNTSGNTLTSASQNTFGIFASADQAAPLPVELREFTAQAQGQDGLLNWATASENGNRGFDVEVSLDSRTFQPVGFVAGFGTTVVSRAYRFTDPGAARRGSLQYYRLRQLDADGTATYSPVRTVAFAPPPASLAVWPNPAHDSYTVLLTVARQQPATLTLYDAIGRKVSELRVLLQSGENRLPTQFAAGQPAGIYLFSTTLDGQPMRTRLVRD
ncbi:T9SS type A sorting domain-containing protein [Hymenobacter canadensis]|uniref:T9SS type A sorting domain-containing protein n=1 Tax=Hymenobacter canadensis TaxID=2999067 RepID=A0ABY7LL02_9BACT|nr:T9SS type A sorting domain-containing protein [Hymenobacter canadensis]WBA41132.1 T9SS type A sorting domain-containing protein [Hymenobacter canadensis]